MDYALLTPEINSGRMYAGPGAGPMLAAAAAWDAIATQLESAAGGYFSEVSGLTGQWLGPSSMSMAAAAAPFIGWLEASAAQATQTAAQAYAAAAAYEAAYLMTVPPPVIAANRAQLTALIATNFFGQNAPAIAATEAQYMQMWAQDATAMYVYAANSTAASTLTSYNEPPRTTNESGQNAQFQAMAQNVGNTTRSQTQSLVQQVSTNTTNQSVSFTPPGDPDPDIPPGGTATVPPGSIINVGTNTTLTVNSGSITLSPGPVVGGFGVTSHSAITLNPGSAFLAVSGWSEGGTPVNPATLITATTQAITLTPTHALIPGIGTLQTGSVTLGANSSVITVNDTAAGFAGIAGATLTNASGTVSYTNVVSIPGLATLSTTPGLAGTAGIQPQYNAEGLADWARRLVGDEIPAAGLG